MNAATTQLLRSVSTDYRTVASFEPIENVHQALWSERLFVQEFEIVLGVGPAQEKLGCVAYQHCYSRQEMVYDRSASIRMERDLAG